MAEIESACHRVTIAPEHNLMPRLIVMESSGNARSVALNLGETTIGRAETNDIVVSAEQVSQVHASILIGPVLVTLKTSSSGHSTFVNGTRVHETLVLANGDVIRLGTCEMRFLADDKVPQAVRRSHVDSRERRD
ncbi:FHA domain-containing protein [Variovorax paradoxus]|nr:FHA domain-containing protein [Variovorax paradoxus]